MRSIDAIPFDPAAQRRTERQWLTTVRDRRVPSAIRGVVRASWERCVQASVQPDLPQAPIALDESALALSQESADWLPLSDIAVGRQQGSFGGPGHILTLFDADGRMLSSQGDPRAREGLAEINFRPGGLWHENAAGTNGPGTALATGEPVHIVGAEHFCQAWHRWHCAAVPIRDPATGALLGVLDISGFREHAHPHSLSLARALVIAIEQMLRAREAERRYLALSMLADLGSRYPGDAALAVDRGGRLLRSSSGVPAALRAALDGRSALRSTLMEMLRTSAGPAPREVTLQLAGDRARPAVWYPVLEGRTAVGGCLVLEKTAAHRRAASQGRSLHDTAYSFADVVGSSPLMREATRLARAAAATTLPVLLLGESGTGKEVFAQAIHAASARADRPFVAVNCAALPRELIESELFGYTGGAYTGARREGGAGKFEAANGGTIFLDEIGELSPGAQAALLRVLQEGEVTRVGSTRSSRLDVRVIAATNQAVTVALETGGLRADLYHRLNVLRITLAPLRERRSDIAELTRRFLEDAAAELGRPDASFSGAVIGEFERRTWQGNVRELRNTVRRLVAVAETFPVTLDDLPGALGEDVVRADPRDDGTADTDDELEQLRRVIASADTMAEAASRLGITRSTLYRRLQRKGLRPHRTLGSR